MGELRRFMVKRKNRLNFFRTLSKNGPSGLQCKEVWLIDDIY